MYKGRFSHNGLFFKEAKEFQQGELLPREPLIKSQKALPGARTLRVAYMGVGEGREQERKAWQSCQEQLAGRPVVRHTDHYLRLPP